MELNDLAKQAYEASKEKGWYDQGGPSPLEKHMLIVSEVAEASEEVRKKKDPFYLEGDIIDMLELSHHPSGHRVVNVAEVSALDIEAAVEAFPKGKPEGEAVELVDALIRIADVFGRNGWDLEAVVKAKMSYNATRPHRNGGKAL